MTDVSIGSGGPSSVRSARPRPPGSRPVRRGRPHPAEGGRIVATGFGMAAMLGSVAVMGLLNRQDTETVEVAPTGPAVAAGPVVVGSAPAAAGSVGGAVATSMATASPATTVAPPIALTAQPVVRVAAEPAASQVAAAPGPAAAPGTAPATAAPRARTNGSR